MLSLPLIGDARGPARLHKLVTNSFARIRKSAGIRLASRSRAGYPPPRPLPRCLLFVPHRLRLRVLPRTRLTCYCALAVQRGARAKSKARTQ